MWGIGIVLQTVMVSCFLMAKHHTFFLLSGMPFSAPFTSAFAMCIGMQFLFCDQNEMHLGRLISVPGANRHTLNHCSTYH